ncbi:MAG: hypothetical protein M3409_12375 [Gemmatimonadota bacterium]|nr:hypothetical protein [Gemmatimonadota bacterium]
MVAGSARWLRGAQWGVALLLLAMGLGATLLPLLLLPPLPGTLAVLLALPLLIPVWETACAPFFRLAGIHRYFSPLLFAEAPEPGTLVVHGGTLWDYLLHLRWSERGRATRRRTLGFYLDGFLAIAADVERGRLSPDTTITGTSYFFNERTARSFGFALHPVDPAQRRELLLNFPVLLCKTSFAEGRLAVPDLSRLRRASITGAGLLRSRDRMRALRARLRQSRGTAAS